MKKKLISILIAIGMLVWIVIILVNNKHKAEEKVYHYDRVASMLILADTVRLNTVSQELQYTGTFEPNRETKIMADVQGKILSIYVDEGDFVKAGMPLVKIDDVLLQKQLVSIEIEIQGLQNDVDRYKVLAQNDAVQGVKLEKAELGLNGAKAQSEQIIEKIKKTTIYAPFSGIITHKFTEVGAYAAPGMPLLQLTDIHTLKFTIQVSELELKYFDLNRANTIQTDALPGAKFSATVSMIGSKGNPAHNYPVQYTLVNSEDLKIKSGMFGKVMVENSTKTKELVIPASALVGSNLKPQVYLVDNGKAILKNINISRRIGEHAVVGSGLQAGDVIVTSGFINLFDGANVVLN